MSTAADSYQPIPGFTPVSTLGPHRAADYWALPEGERVELILGELLVSPAPKTLHQIVVGRLFARLQSAELQGGGLALLAPADVVLSDDAILQPDLLYVSAGRRRIVGERVQGPPDLVIEVISEGAERRDRVDKLALYARYGVAEYWIVDPRAQSIEFLLLGDEGRYVVHTGVDNRYQSPRLAEIAIDLAALWQEVAARTT
jgi:Uma2 family endonuclease